MEIRRNPFGRGSCLWVLLLAAVLCGGTTLKAFPFQQETKPDQAKDQSESKKQAKKEKETEAANRLPAVLWRDPGDISSRDLLNGEGGENDAPDPHADYTFIKEDLNGSSPKFYAQDSNGVKWLVKLGVEARPETAATRLVWAMGYYTDEDYFLPRIHVRNFPKLRHKIKGASPKTGIVLNARLKRQGEGEKVENWDWFNNPFVGTRELNGLRVLMAVINNWDLITKNNKLYVANDERHFVVSDLGASFGKTGWPPSHVPLVPHATKGVLKDYAHSKFIRAIRGTTVSFEMRNAPASSRTPSAERSSPSSPASAQSTSSSRTIHASGPRSRLIGAASCPTDTTPSEPRNDLRRRVRRCKPVGEALDGCLGDPQGPAQSYDGKALTTARRQPAAGELIGGGAADPQYGCSLLDGEEPRGGIGCDGWFVCHRLPRYHLSVVASNLH